ncbi:MAG TPA: ABC transporter substrate-binding protein [Burkholderiaceae bacterium]|nr:ABC transporter substrate-binding protein [Burkholderiaceae bacterium]
MSSNDSDVRAWADVCASRRALITAGAAAGALQLAPPLLRSARGEEPVRIGFDNPLTGPYAVGCKNELAGCELAIEQINAKGGILGRKAKLLVEDSTSGDTGTAVQKARKLIDRDKVDFLIGSANSAQALAMAEVSFEKNVLHIVPGAHADAITGPSCRWNVFRVCNTTQTEASAVAANLVKTAGKKWYYITPDYVFGHTLQSALEKAGALVGATKVGADLTPIGTADFSAYLIKAQAANPEVIVFLVQGDDMIGALKQAVQFGLDRRLHLAGAQQELEALEGLPPEARIGSWVIEWYWKQPGNPHVEAFVEAVRGRTGRVPTARTWFGYVATWTCALAATEAKSLEAVKMARALEGMRLPPEIGLMPQAPFYRAGDHQMIGTLFVGNAQAQGSAPDDLFQVTQLVRGVDAAGPVGDSGCKLVYPGQPSGS